MLLSEENAIKRCSRKPDQVRQGELLQVMRNSSPLFYSFLNHEQIFDSFMYIGKSLICGK